MKKGRGGSPNAKLAKIFHTFPRKHVVMIQESLSRYPDCAHGIVAVIFQTFCPIRITEFILKLIGQGGGGREGVEEGRKGGGRTEIPKIGHYTYL